MFDELDDSNKLLAIDSFLDYEKYFSEGSNKFELEEYNSYNTHRLSEIELKELLAQIDVK